MTTITKIITEEVNPFYIISSYTMFSAGYLKKESENYGCIGKYSAIIGVEICALLTTAIGTIETIFWTAVFLFVKTVHMFIPRSFEIPTSICAWILGNTLDTLSITRL